MVLAYLRCFVEYGPGWSGFLRCGLCLEQILGACPRACVVVPGEVGLLWSFELALVSGKSTSWVLKCYRWCILVEVGCFWCTRGLGGLTGSQLLPGVQVLWFQARLDCSGASNLPEVFWQVNLFWSWHGWLGLICLWMFLGASVRLGSVLPG